MVVSDLLGSEGAAINPRLAVLEDLELLAFLFQQRLRVLELCIETGEIIRRRDGQVSLDS